MGQEATESAKNTKPYMVLRVTPPLHHHQNVVCPSHAAVDEGNYKKKAICEVIWC